MKGDLIDHLGKSIEGKKRRGKKMGVILSEALVTADRQTDRQVDRQTDRRGFGCI